MKKILLVITAALLLLFPTCIYAEDKPVEMPDVKFIVNNLPIELTDVPLGLNGRTLLPLRAALTSLGVPNDDRHIIWNGKEGSVTVVNDGKSIYLKLGSNTALVDGEAVKLDAAPLQYLKNQRVYIPVRFISNAVGKDVVWDGSAKSVIIRDHEKYAAMYELIKKTAGAMDAVGKVKFNSGTKLDIVKKGLKTSLDIKVDEQLDKKAELMYSSAVISMFGADISILNFFKDNIEFTKISEGAWERTMLKESDFKSLIVQDVSLSSLNLIEVMAASLERQEGKKAGEFILKGPLYPKGIAEDICKKTGIGNMTPESCSFEAVIDESTNLVKSIHAEFGGRVVNGASASTAAAVIDVGYSDYNSDFTIKTPDGL